MQDTHTECPLRKKWPFSMALKQEKFKTEIKVIIMNL